jgi:hypothetical protein
MYLEALAGKRSVLGAEHPETCTTLRTIGLFYIKQRRYGEAESASLAAYDGLVKALGEDNVETQKAIAQLARLYVASGQPAKAKQWEAKMKSSSR